MKFLNKKDKTAASSIHPDGEPVSENTASPLNPTHPKTTHFDHSDATHDFAKGLPHDFHLRLRRGESDPSHGFVIEYSLHHYNLSDGDKIARQWAIQRGFEDTGSGCALVGEPIRDIDFTPFRYLPTLFSPSDTKNGLILPRLYRIEIQGSFLSVTFESRRIPLLPNPQTESNQEHAYEPYQTGFNAIHDFLCAWASNHHLAFCSSCLTPPKDITDAETRSYISFSPTGMNGTLSLLVTPGIPYPEPDGIDAPLPPPTDDDTPPATPITTP